MLLGVRSLLAVQEVRLVLMGQSLLYFLDRHHVAVAHHQIDIVERNALGLQAVVDDLAVEAAVVLFACNSLLADRKSDLAVAQQTGAHVVVVSVNAEYVRVRF